MDSLIPAFGNLAFTIVAFIVALSIIVAIHEYGHYIVGRWSGIKAETFSIGFGKVLFSRTDRHGTRWQIAALPFGGYVKFLGDANAASAGRDDEAMAALSEEEQRQTMHGAPLWARAATVFAGPAFNFGLSILIFGSLVLYHGVPTDDVVVDEVFTIPDAKQELASGDVVLKIAGIAFGEEGATTALRELEPKRTIPYEVMRDGEIIEVEGPWFFPTLAAGVEPGSAANKAGVEEGDVIQSVNGTPIFDFEHLRTLVGGSNGEPVELGIYREGEILSKTMTARKQDRPTGDGGFETRYLIGVFQGTPFSVQVETPGIGEALWIGTKRTVNVVTTSISGLTHLIAGKISRCSLSGPIGIAKTSGYAASDGWITFIGFIAVLSTAVGFLNLLPIPVLDGGHLVFHAWEATTGRPPNENVLKYLMAVGLALMLALMVFATGNDLFC